MEFRYRQEIVGKRFLCVKRGSKLKIKDLKNWEWQSGVVRALTDREYLDPEVLVLLEFDGQDWNDRKWIKITEEYQLFLVEKTIVWATNNNADSSIEGKPFLALNFEVLFDKLGFKKSTIVPVQTLLQYEVKFVETSEVSYHKTKVDDKKCNERELDAVKQWYHYQDGQQILIQTPTVLVGYRVEVYRAEGTTQWFTAVIQSYNENEQELKLTDDTVLEEHYEDPALIEIRLIGEEVVASILRGDDLRVRPSRTRKSIDRISSHTPKNLGFGTNHTPNTSSVAKKPSNTSPKEVSTKAEVIVKQVHQESSRKNQVSEKSEKVVKTAKRRKCEATTKGGSTTSVKDVCSTYGGNSKTAKSIHGSDTSNIRESNNRTPTKSLIVPLCDISPKKNKGRRCLSASPNPKKGKRLSEENQCTVKTRKRLKSLESVRNSGIESINRDKVTNTGIHKQNSAVKCKKSKGKNLFNTANIIQTQEKGISIQKEQQKEKSSKSDKQSHEQQTSNRKYTRKSVDKSENINQKACNNNKVIKDKPRKNKGAVISSLKNRSCDNNCITLNLQGIASSTQKSIDGEHLSSSEEVNNSEKAISGTEIIASSQVTRKEKSASKDNKHTESSSLSGNVSVVTSTASTFSFSLLSNKAVTVVCSESSALNNSQQNCKPSCTQNSAECSSSNSNINCITDLQECNNISVPGVTNTTSIAKTSLSCSPSTILSSEDSRDMHYKKSILGDYQRKESGGQPSPDKSDRGEAKSHIDTAGINLNQSLTDQIARREKSSVKSDHHHRIWEDVVKCTSNTNGMDTNLKFSDSFLHSNENKTRVMSSNSSPYVPVDRKVENKHTVTTANSNVDSDRTQHLYDERTHMRISDPRPSTSSTSQSRETRTDDRGREREPSSSNSPLLVDKGRPVEPYRDPELLKMDEMKQIQALHQQAVHNPLPQSINPAVPAVPAALSGHPSTLPSHAAVLSQTHPLLSHIAGAGAVIPPQYASIQEQAAFAAQIGYLRQLASMQQTQLTPITFSGIQNPYQTRQLELLWQQKFPNIQVPPGWLLHQYQDELLRDVNMMQHRDLIEREREMREREMVIERERMDREIRDREDRERERVERERIERERQERERQERERQERERREREERDRLEREKAAERERQERERREKERQQEQLRERERREILMESRAAADAVDKHFQESLNRLNSQQHKAFSTGTWIPGGAASKPSPLQAMSVSSQPQYKVSAFCHVGPSTSSSQHSPHMDRKPEEKPRVTEYQPMMAHSHGRNPSPQDIKPKLSPQDLSQKSTRLEQDSKQGISLRQSLIEGFPPSDPAHVKSDIKPFPGYPGPQNFPPIKNTLSSGTSGSGVPTTAIPSIKQEANFNLYGYPYRHPMYISQDKLAQGLKEEKGVIKQEPTDLRNKTSRPMNSPPPLVKSEPHPGSVIVENKPDIIPGGHGHGSITLGTSRNQEDSKAGIVTTSSHMRGGSPHIPHKGQPVPPPLQQSKGPIPATVTNNSSISYSAMQQAYLAALAQQQAAALSSAAMTHSATSHSPIYSQSKDSVNYPDTNKQQQHSPNTQKRRAQQPQQQKDQPGLINSKKTKVEPTGPASYVAGAKPGGTFVDSFRSFVENAVQCAFHQDLDKRDKFIQQQWQQQQMAQQKQHQVTKSQEPEQPQQQQTPVPLVVEEAVRNITPCTSTTTSVSQSVQRVNTPSTDAAPPVIDTSSSHLKVIECSSPAPLPTSISSSSISSIQETINRVANGIDTDSDTLSAPSPPPTLKSSDAPSPVRFPISKPSFKKAILARYSGDTIPHSENSNSSLGDQSPPKLDKQEKMEISPLSKEETNQSKPLTMKSPLSLLSKDINMPDDMTTSASEAESQDNDSSSTSSKGKKKAAKRKSDNSGNMPSNKKQKSAPSSDSETNTKKKKKNSKNKGEDKDSQSKDTTKSSASDKPHNESTNNTNTLGTSHLVTKASQKQPPKTEMFETNSMKNNESANTNVSSNFNGKNNEKDSSKDNNKKVCKQTEIVKPKYNWDCEKKMREWHEKQQKKEKEGKKGGKKEKAIEKNEKSKDKKQDKDGGEASEEDGKENPSSILANKPLNKPHAKLKKNQDPFLQDASCGEIAPKLMKCRECKMRNKKLPNIFCRFYAFRRLKYNPKGCISIAGFSEPSDADVDDIDLWYPRYPLVPSGMDLEMAKYVMANVGDRFCELVEQEKEAMMWTSPDTKIVWKRAVQGVREMCDVCVTTLFNMHWCCHKCGFVVCIDCYRNKAKKIGSNQDKSCKVNEEASSNQKWITCSANRQQHEPDKLKITQIIPSDVLWALGNMIHDVRDHWNMQSNCPCGHVSSKVSQMIQPKNGMSQHLFNAVTQSVSTDHKDNKPLVNGIGGNSKKSNKLAPAIMDSNALNGSPLMSPLNLLAEAAASRESECKKETDTGGSSSKVCSTLRDLLTRQGTAVAGMKAPPSENNKKPKVLTDILQEVVDRNQSKEDSGSQHHNHQRIKTIQFSHYVPKSGAQMQGRNSPIPTYTLKETSVQYPDIPHSWLDHGRLLRLHDARCKKNLSMFQQQWRRGQPVIVSHCDKYLNKELWSPKAFGKEFGHEENDLVNCTNGIVMMGHKMKVFWEGFEKIGARLKDGKNRPLNLKLKDWPSTEDFSELMPSRFHDLMQSLPLPEYSNRTGTFNLACRLPEFFVKPDLGPKMYNAYGSAMQPKTGSTNLHLDMSDAVNLMVYVGIPEDDKDNQEKAVLEIMQEAGCCEFTLDRSRDSDERPGALWHIFDPQDADKIRDLLNKVGSERGDKVDVNHDPIHDQAWYLDSELRERLLSEYGVQGYSIVQYLGDAVFIPAGAPHQVKNLHSCIKVAEDFVSPENINHCFKMTQEFRYLSGTHSNHEDKLQIKNIIYHAVKDAVAVLQNNNPNSVE